MRVLLPETVRSSQMRFGLPCREALGVRRPASVWAALQQMPQTALMQTLSRKSDAERRTPNAARISARILVVLALARLCLPTPVRAQELLALWYRQPAAKWTEALPLGNG